MGSFVKAVIGLICLGIFLGSLFRKKSNVSSSKIKNGRLVVTFTVLGTFSGITILPYMTGTVGVFNDAVGVGIGKDSKNPS